MKSVYLAGPITGLTFDDAADGWRQYATDRLAPKVAGLSPLRGIETEARQYLPVDHVEGELAKRIVTRDFNDIKTCDALLVCFLDAPRVSIGTVWELGAAYALQKPVIVVMERKTMHDHAFIHQSSMLVTHDIDHGIDVIKHLLGVDPS